MPVPDLVSGPVVIAVGLFQVAFRRPLGTFAFRTNEKIFTRLGFPPSTPDHYASGWLLVGVIFCLAGSYLVLRGLGVWG